LNWKIVSVRSSKDCFPSCRSFFAMSKSSILLHTLKQIRNGWKGSCRMWSTPFSDKPNLAYFELNPTKLRPIGWILMSCY
jgi:hypothetical protein